MNRDHHTSYQCRRVNRKGGSDIVTNRSGPGYMMVPQCLLYKEPRREEQKNKGYSGRFPHLQGHVGHMMTLIPQAGYTTSSVRMDTHVHGKLSSPATPCLS